MSEAAIPEATVSLKNSATGITRETTTSADRNLGIVNLAVGFAPLKPAEFVVIQIQQIPDLG